MSKLNSAHAAPTAEGLLTEGDVATLLQVSRRSVARLRKSRVLPFIKVGHSVRFRRADIERALARRAIREIT
jgi:excisionase family DNA binding protein